MPNIISKERIHYFDVAKGILILLLVLFHFQSAIRHMELPIENRILSTLFWQKIITAFFMPCFFFISGYCSNFENESSFFFKKVVRQLLIPWSCFELLQAAFWAIYYSDYSFDRFRTFLLTEPCTTLWFLNALAFSKILVYILKKLFHNGLIILFISFLFLVLAILVNQLNIGHNYLAIRESFGSCFFVALGYYMKRNMQIYNLFISYSPYIYLFIFIFLVLISIPIPSFTAGMHISIRQFPIFILLSTTGSFSFLYICRLINCNSIIEYFGKNSLPIYGLHICPLCAFVVILYKTIYPTTFLQFGYYLLAVYVLTICICSFLVTILQLKCLKWIIGK